MPAITPVLLVGGSGTRLWPLSRKSFPKQFAALTGPVSLFQAAATRLSGPEFAAPMLLTHADFRFIVTEQLAAVGVTPGAILIEPESRNTGPAILAAALHAVASDPEAVLLIAPSDHEMPDPAAFRAALLAGLSTANDGAIVTFGIKPTRAETGYGWLELAEAPRGGGPQPLTRFVEKPDAARAEAMLASGRHLWNAGIFLARAQTLIDAFARHAPDMLPPVRAAVEAAQSDLGFLRLAVEPWGRARDISVEYAIMERAVRLFGARCSENVRKPK